MRRNVKTIAAPNESDTALTLALVLGLFGVLAGIGSSWRPSPASADSSSAMPPVIHGSLTSPVKTPPQRLTSPSWSGRSTGLARRSQHPERGST